MNYKIGDRVNYTGKLYVIKNPQGVITGIRDREVNRPIDILFDGYDESLCCYESEIRSATISFDKFTAFIDNIKDRTGISNPYPYVVGYFESLIQHLYYIGDDNVKDEIIRSLERI